jgi:hypothetical protein
MPFPEGVNDGSKDFLLDPAKLYARPRLAFGPYLQPSKCDSCLMVKAFGGEGLRLTCFKWLKDGKCVEESWGFDQLPSGIRHSPLDETQRRDRNALY